MEKISHNRAENPQSREVLLEEWNRRLAAEGMPEEPELDSCEEDHTHAYGAAIEELEGYFLTTDRHEFGAHRAKAAEVLGHMKAGGANEAEIAEFERDMDDFARVVEDAVTNLMNDALQLARDVTKRSPLLAARPDSLARIVASELKKSSPSVCEQTIYRAAEMVVQMS